MRALKAILTAATFIGCTLQVTAQGLIDRGYVAGWNIMVDPALGNGCLIQTIFQDYSVVRIGFDAAKKQGYFVVFNKAWGDIKKGKTYDITFELDGKKFDAVATGFFLDKVPGAGVTFTDRNFVYAIAKSQVMTVYNEAGEQVMAIDLSGSGKAIEYARKCQAETGSG
ncbi:MAG: hypothetical protein ABJI96_10010 [Paracoccaceae bacterium]